MNGWIVIVPLVAFALLAAAGWLAAYAAHGEAEVSRKVARKLADANRQLYAENADLREEVQERRAEIENLRHERDTVQMHSDKLQLQLYEALDRPKARPKTYGVPMKKVEDGQ